MPTNRVAEFSTNGKPAKKAATARPTKAERDARAQRTRLRQRVAAVVGCIGVGVITLSVVHVTDAITQLTSTHWALSMLLALGIDAGLVSAEISELIAHDDENVQRWARRYVAVTVALSMLLNSWAFASHAESAISIAAGVVLGVVIPALCYMLARVAGYLARPDVA